MLIVVIANSVQNAMVGQDTSLVGGMVAALTLLVLNRAFIWLVFRHPEFRHWMIGQPVLIVRDGHFLREPMRKEGVTHEHVLATMREHGIAQLENVQMAILEVDGAISIVPKETQVHRTRHHFRGLRIQ